MNKYNSDRGFSYETSTIAEITKGIILASYERLKIDESTYQSEAELERKLIDDLKNQGYKELTKNSDEELLKNVKFKLESLNKVKFTDKEWLRFRLEYLDKPNDTMVDKTRKVQNDHVYDFVFDDGSIKNIYILDKQNIHNNYLEVTSQVVQKGESPNRSDVTILVNGLPLVHIELKRRGVNLKNAFDHVHRYKKESFNKAGSLYKFVQIFVISNGTKTKYFANTTANNKNHYEFCCDWADGKNKVISDLVDFTATFFEKRTLLEIITKYCVFDASDTLLVMRPYQIAAAERIWWKIKSSYENKKSGTLEAGGYIWHTTGSGKTLTSFKAARLATNLEFIDKVLFVVDRKDLDYQTMKEYEKFQPGSVNGTVNTRHLKLGMEKMDDKIVVTTIQKLNEFVKRNKNHEIFKKHCVIIYDECHRSQFGDAQKNIKKTFKNYYQFGFTGTPIFIENKIGTDTTQDIFGRRLHNYVITDAIRDGKVLKFKVDYNNIKAKFKEAESENNPEKLKKLEKKMLLHPERISEVSKHILKSFPVKTGRNIHYTVRDKRQKGFNAMLAVQSIDAAKSYYDEIQKQQLEFADEKRLKIATIFSYAPNEYIAQIGEIDEENFEPKALDLTSKEFLEKVIIEYNENFKTNYSTDGGEFQNYYKDLSKRVKNKEIDLLIVVGMFLTGFDAPMLNTLYVDKNLRYHGLLQAFSRTNRILNKKKAFGNIVCFRDLEQATKDSIRTFGSDNDINIVLTRSFDEYFDGYYDEITQKRVKGYVEICEKLMDKFSNPTEIHLESEKREFVELFGEMLKAENVLKNFDEFSDFEKIIPVRTIQDMKSVYLDILEKRRRDNTDDDLDLSDIEFEIELLKTDEINLDYILALILEKSKEMENDDVFEEEIRRVIRSNIGVRAKEELIMTYIERTKLSDIRTNEDILESFYSFAREEKKSRIKKLAIDEKLTNSYEKYIERSIEKGYADSGGSDLDMILPPTTRMMGKRELKKQQVLAKIEELVDIFVGI